MFCLFPDIDGRGSYNPLQEILYLSGKCSHLGDHTLPTTCSQSQKKPLMMGGSCILN